MSIEETTKAALPEMLHTDRVIIASNRGPVEYHLSQDNALEYNLGSGGLVTALSGAANFMEATWVAMALTEGDRLASSKAQQESDGVIRLPQYHQKMQLRYVTIPRDTFEKYYGRITTELLWFTYSHLYDLAKELASDQQIVDAWINGYCVANQAIADAVCAEIGHEDTETVVMLHDFFLTLVSSMIRERYPSILMQQFLHWPWPDVRYLYLLPSNIIQAIYSGLLGNDILGFQTDRDAHNFLDGARAMLKDAAIDFEEGVLRWRGHRTLVRTYPISISVAGERLTVQSAASQEEMKKIHHLLNKKVIMRVDRIDPVKNIIGGFQAYTQLLDEHPELLGEVIFLAFLVPTRETAPVYQRYKAEVFKVIEEINQKYGLPEWTPIHAFYGNNRTRALTAMQFYDVLLINPIADGMNLVAKEGAVVNQRDGVLVLSRTAGAFLQLEEACIPISPTSTLEIARALYKALTLSPQERYIKASQARHEVERYDIKEWLSRQVHDINSLIDNP